jgi:aspartyl-tRNA(Asn)/glutamyl-tRNA(Gln) amidotransferase subunit B
MLEKGETISQETRGFDALKGITISMRSKEAANDYRYFPEPDLQPLFIDQKQIDLIKAEMPALPRELFQKYTSKLGLTAYDAGILTDSKPVALYFEEIIKNTNNFKAAANLVMGDVKSYLNHNGLEMEEFPVEARTLAQLIHLIEEGKISSTVASQNIFPELTKNPEKNPLEIATELNLIQESDEGSLIAYIQQVIDENPVEIARYIAGEKQLTGFLMGKLMKVSGGKADPKQANQLMRKMLDELSA